MCEKLSEKIVNGKVVYPYEIHVTIKNPGDDLIGEFISVCKNINVKSIVLDLENDGKSVMLDVMTSSHIFGNDEIALTEANRIKIELQDNGFEVLRVKIESVPWHPMAPKLKEDKMPKDCYFEAHIGCMVSIEEKAKLKKVGDMFGAHLSKNAFKKIDNGKFINMITLRNYNCTNKQFESEVESLKNILTCSGFLFEKVIVEFALYDTKVSHDYIWLK